MIGSVSFPEQQGSEGTRRLLLLLPRHTQNEAMAKKSADMLKVGIFGWEDDSGSSGGPNVITRVLIKGGGCVRVSEGEVMMKTVRQQERGTGRCYPAGSYYLSLASYPSNIDNFS